MAPVKSPQAPPTDSDDQADFALFLREMAQLDVRAKRAAGDGAAKAATERSAAAPPSHEDEALFLRAFDELGRRPGADEVEPDEAEEREASAPAPRSQAGTVGPEALSSRALLRRLRKGDLEPTDRLDLHRLRKSEAIQRTGVFLRSSRQAGHRAVLIITGRGGHGDGLGVLREWMPLEISRRWPEHVHGVLPAPPRLGGAGAFIVLLRRPDEE